VNILKKASAILDSAIELPYAISACATIAREARESTRDDVETLRARSTEIEVSHSVLQAELSRVQLALGKATEELKAARDLAERRRQALLELNNVRDTIARSLEAERVAVTYRDKKIAELEELHDVILADCKKQTADRDALAHRLDWITRWREGKCPFPSRTKVFRWHADTEAQLHYTEEWPGRPWRPANLDLYEEFRDA
jgi:chromosome segregation ATPase